MAYSKIILNGETLMDVTSDTVAAGSLLSGKTATKNDGTKATGNIASKTASDLTASGATVTAAAGYYPSAVSKAVTTTTHPNPTAAITSSTGIVTASHTQGTGYVTGGTTTGTTNLTTQAATTYNTSTADQTITSYRWLTGNQTIKSVTTSNLTAANIAEGVVVKVGDANNASRITQVTGTHSGATSYTATISGTGNSSYCYVTYSGTKYYSNNGTFTYKAGDTLTIYCRGNNVKVNGDSVTLSSYSYTYTLPVGDITINLSYSSSTSNSIAIYGLVQPTDTLTISAAGTHNTYKYSAATVAAGSAFPPAVTITTNPTIGVNTSGVVTATYTGSSSITPTVNAGYVTAGTAGAISTTGTSTYQLTSKAAATYYPSTADQTIASQRWLVGNQTIKSVTTSNLTAANIKSGTVVKVGDVNNASRITQVTGTYAPTISSVTVTPTSTTQTFNASGVDGYKPVTVNGDSNLKAENIADGVSIFGVTGTYTDAPSYTATINGSGSTSGRYVGYAQTPDGIQHYTDGDTFTFKAGQNLYLYVAGPGNYAYIYVNDVQVKYSSGGSTGYDYVLPNSNISIDIYFGASDVSIRIYSSIIPSGTYNITSNGTYNVTNYASASVNLPFYEVYSTVATNWTYIASSSAFIEWMNTQSYIRGGQFAGRIFSGSFTLSTILKVEGGAFALPDGMGFTNLSFTMDLPNCSSITTGAFNNQYYLRSINCPVCTYIGYSAFQSCSNLRTISFPICNEMNNNAFAYCSYLTEAIFPKCTIIPSSAFFSCSSLATISFPEATNINSQAFMNCRQLSSVYLPKVTQIVSSVFYQCYSLTSINLPQCSSVGGYAFTYCQQLSIVSIPICTTISSSAFFRCYNLISLYLNSVSAIPTLGTNAFQSTPISNYSTSAGRYGSIFVPASLFESFKTATGWAAYSARMVSV